MKKFTELSMNEKKEILLQLSNLMDKEISDDKRYELIEFITNIIMENSDKVYKNLPYITVSCIAKSIFILNLNEYDLAFILERLPLKYAKEIIRRIDSVLYSRYRRMSDYNEETDVYINMIDRFIINDVCKRKSVMKYLLKNKWRFDIKYMDAYIKYGIVSKEYLTLGKQQQLQYIMCLSQVLNRRICHDHAIYKNITSYYNFLDELTEDDILLFRLIVRDMFRTRTYLINVFTIYQYESHNRISFTRPEEDQLKLLSAAMSEIKTMNPITIRTFLETWKMKIEKYNESLYYYKPGTGIFGYNIDVYEHCMKILNQDKKIKTIFMELKLKGNK